MELDLRVRQRRGAGAARRLPASSQRRSMNTATQIEASKRMRIGTVWRTIETRSTPGRRTTAMMQRPTPMRRFRRRHAVERTPSRTSPRMKIGSSKTSAAADDRDRRERVVLARADLGVVQLRVVFEEERNRVREHDPVGKGHPAARRTVEMATKKSTTIRWACSSNGGREEGPGLPDEDRDRERHSRVEGDVERRRERLGRAKRDRLHVVG